MTKIEKTEDLNRQIEVSPHGGTGGPNTLENNKNKM